MKIIKKNGPWLFVFFLYNVVLQHSLLGDVLPLFERYLGLPEYVSAVDREFEELFDGKSGIAGYPEMVIEPQELESVIQQCINTFDSGDAPYATRSSWLNHDMPDCVNDETNFCGAYIQRIRLLPGSKIYFFGDLHGSVHGLIRDLCHLMALGVVDKDLKIIDPSAYIVFLGDLVDYGRFGVDALYIVALLRIANPERVIICRGNHEDFVLNQTHSDDYASIANTFHGELFTRYGEENLDSLAAWISQLYEYLPLAVFAQIEGDRDLGVMQWCHGGIEPKAKQLINNLLNSDFLFAQLLSAEHFTTSQELNVHNKYGTSSGFCWSDFSGRKGLRVSSRPHWLFGIDTAAVHMARNNIRLIMRGHQDRDEHCKMLMRDIDEPVALFSLIPEHIGLVDDLREKTGQELWARMPKSPEALRVNGLSVADLPRDDQNFVIAPIYTVTNASAAKATCSHGLVMLTCGQNIEESRLRVDSYTNEILAWRGQGGTVHEEILSNPLFDDFADDRKFNYQDYRFLPQSIDGDESDESFAQRRDCWAQEAYEYFWPAYAALFYWPLYTTIRDDGQASISCAAPEEIEEVLSENYPEYIVSAYKILKNIYTQAWPQAAEGSISSGFKNRMTSIQQISHPK